MEIWAGINAPAGRKKDQGIGMHPMQAVCRRVCLHEGYVCVRLSSRGCKTRRSACIVLQYKGIKSHKYIYRD